MNECLHYYCYFNRLIVHYDEWYLHELLHLFLELWNLYSYSGLLFHHVFLLCHVKLWLHFPFQELVVYLALLWLHLVLKSRFFCLKNNFQGQNQLLNTTLLRSYQIQFHSLVNLLSLIH